LGNFNFFLFVQLDSSIGYASLKKQGGLGKYIIIVLGFSRRALIREGGRVAVIVEKVLDHIFRSSFGF